MGTLKKHIQGVVLDRFSCSLTAKEVHNDIPTWHDINGTAYTTIGTYALANQSNQLVMINKYRDLRACASNETLEDFDINSYQFANISDVVVTTSKTDNITSITYNVAIRNGSNINKIVNSIKFAKQVAWNVGSVNFAKDALIWTYYLDNAVTISPNEVKTISVTFDFTLI